MTSQPTSLLEILAPPPNRWLMAISRRRVDLPSCVRVVRFSEDSDDQATDAEAPIKLNPAPNTRKPVSGRR